jgi:xanthine dehydrogenase accessory factor
VFESQISLGSVVRQGEVVATVDGVRLEAPFEGALRGLLHSGLYVEVGMKVGDIDPRGQPSFCYQISDKALAIGGGVLEAILSSSEIRSHLGG